MKTAKHSKEQHHIQARKDAKLQHNMLRNVRITPGMRIQAAESPSDLHKNSLVMSSKAHDQNSKRQHHIQAQHNVI
jgi:hypothetical protein